MGKIQEFLFRDIRSTPTSRSNKVGLKYPSVRPSVHKKVYSISVKFGM